MKMRFDTLKAAKNYRRKYTHNAPITQSGTGQFIVNFGVSGAYLKSIGVKVW